MATTTTQLEMWTDDFTTAAFDTTVLAANHLIPQQQTPPRTPTSQPIRFVQHLASQIQLLACLKWLGEFQVLALIPLRGSVLATEIAELAGVPAAQLSRVVRMAATAGFLHESQPGRIAHTSLSAAFVTDLSLLDAAMFLAESAAPTALHMATATRRRGDDRDGGMDGAYAIALDTRLPFPAACAQQKRLQRQWTAYRQCAGERVEGLAEVLGRLNWRSLGSACVVDVCAQSTDLAVSLAEHYPSLHFIVQLRGGGDDSCYPAAPNDEIRAAVGDRITVQKKMSAGIQLVTDAAVYLLRLPTLRQACLPKLLAELDAHLAVLRANPSATLVLAPPLLPEPGSIDPETEAIARVRDLSKLQLTNEGDMEVSELVEIINGVKDEGGRLVVVNRLRFRNGAIAAVSVKFEPANMGM